MPKTFTAIVPLSLKAASETYQFAPAVRIGNQILMQPFEQLQPGTK
jgi:hypothetical protein